MKCSMARQSMRLAVLLATSALFCVSAFANQAISESSETEQNVKTTRFIFVPYPITEPAVGNGLLAGPVWMRDGPSEAAGPSKPQAYGFGALWTDGGSRGVIAFDHRAWAGGRWRTTFIAARADIELSYSGLDLQEDLSRGFTLGAEGAMVEAERRLGRGFNSLSFRLFSATTTVDFDASIPPELSAQPREAHITGLGLAWSRDTRDDIFTPSSGYSVSARITAYPEFLGSSFDAQTLSLKWTSYRPAFGHGVLGFQTGLELSYGEPPFYLRPYVSLRGVAAMRYSGEQVASFEAEYRLPVNSRWDLLAFGGVGTARTDFRHVTSDKTVTTAGIGVRFKVNKLFGLTFGLDVAQGPDGSVGYVQIGNAWSR